MVTGPTLVGMHNVWYSYLSPYSLFSHIHGITPQLIACDVGRFRWQSSIHGRLCLIPSSTPFQVRPMVVRQTPVFSLLEQ